MSPRPFIATLLGLAICPASTLALEAPLEMHTRVAAQKAIDRGLDYLVASQKKDGGWVAFDKSHPAITALVVKSLVQDKRFGPDHPTAKRGLAYVLRFVQPDGGVYVPDEGMRNYHSSVALLVLAATKDSKHKPTIEGLQRFLKKIQWDDDEGHEASSTFYGGQGYGRHKRPDLSNTQLMLEALHQSGLPESDPAYQKALVFVSRCQMLGESNDQPFADGSNEGGFVYTPVGGGESKAGTVVEDGKPRLRSYGSMTYAGFKSMLFAGLGSEDVRVKRATAWISRHYTLDHNPNMPGEQSKQGLYYYYHIFARALDAWGEEVIADDHNVPHRWRTDLCEKLISLQHEDGHWVNDQDRWYEGNPDLVTAYAILSLQTAMSPSH